MKEKNIELSVRFDALKEELLYINSYFNMFRRLFFNPELVEQLNRIDPAFFSAVRKTFQRYIILEFAKLLDHPTDNRRSNPRENLSLRNFIESFLETQNLDEKYKVDLNLKYKLAESYFKELEQLRNKFLAHSDLEVKLGILIVKYPDLNQIEEINFFCIDTLNWFENIIYGQTTIYSMIGNSKAGGLLAYLVRGMRYEQLSKERKIDHLDHKNLMKFD